MGADPEPTDTREAIMWAVYRVLADDGFAGLTTQRVADEAGCSQSLVHYHFDTKEDLVVAFLEWIRAGEADWLAGLGDGPAEERLRRFVEVQLSVPRDDEHGRFNVAFLELNAAAARNERYADALREFSRLQQDAVVDIVRSGVEDGTFEPVDPEATARFLRLALQGAIAESLTLGNERTKPEVRSAAETYIDDVLLVRST